MNKNIFGGKNKENRWKIHLPQKHKNNDVKEISYVELPANAIVTFFIF